MQKIMVCQHVAHEILGTLDPLLKQNKIRIRYINFERNPNQKPNIESYDGLILLGGPMNVDQTAQFPFLKFEIELINQALKKNIPILGICLGSQLIAKALGAPVKKNPIKEIGWYKIALKNEGQKDPVLHNLWPESHVFQWHGDTFELPQECSWLASSKDCSNQAFRYRDNVYGLQFHLEVDRAMILRWLKIEQNQKELAEIKDQTNPEKIVKETKLYLPHLLTRSQQCFLEFIRLITNPNQKRILTSK